MLPELKKEIPRLGEVYSQVLQDVVRRLDRAYQAFFRRVKAGSEAPGFPKFRSARRYDSFTYPQSGFRITKEGTGGRLKLSKIGVVKIKMHRPIEGKIKTLTIRRKADKWYACFSCEIEQPEPLEPTGRVCGIDLGIWYLATTSDGVNIELPQYLQQAERKLKQLQRAVSRKQLGSSNMRKAVLLLAKAHEKVANQRRHYAFQVANQLLREYDGIAMEDLSIKRMMQDPHYAKRISNAGWGILQETIVWKAKQWGREVEFVDPNNTTQLCSECGEFVEKTMSDDYHDCPHCGCYVMRKINSAKNILNRSRLGQSLCGALHQDRIEARSPRL
jgi:putative transposase